MVLALLSDLHANPFALGAVLRDMDETGFDAILCAGDFVGYYAWPDDTIGLIEARELFSVRGNHDQLVLDIHRGTQSEITAPADPLAAATLNAASISSAHLDWLEALEIEQGFQGEGWSVSMVHGTPADPLQGRLYPDGHWPEDWPESATTVQVLGQTHHPMCRRSPTGQYVVNPGSVGQPRDGDWRASWIRAEMHGDGTPPRFTVRRVEYPVEDFIRALRQSDWPAQLLPTAPVPGDAR